MHKNQNVAHSQCIHESDVSSVHIRWQPVGALQQPVAEQIPPVLCTPKEIEGPRELDSENRDRCDEFGGDNDVFCCRITFLYICELLDEVWICELVDNDIELPGTDCSRRLHDVPIGHARSDGEGNFTDSGCRTVVGPEQIGVLFHLVRLWREDAGSPDAFLGNRVNPMFLGGSLSYRNGLARAMVASPCNFAKHPVCEGLLGQKGGSMSRDGTGIATPPERLAAADLERIYRSLRRVRRAEE